jgi:F0F1-type ATP synthase beta subunit
MEELVRRLSSGSEGVSLFTLAPFQLASLAGALQEDGYSEGTVGPVQTFYFRSEDGAWTPDRLAALAPVDVVIRLSVDLAGLGIYPTVDPLASRSRLLDSGSAGPEHVEIAARARAALSALAAARAAGSPIESPALERALKLQRFFAQPFYVAEPYTKRPGVAVGLAEALRVCREILDGEHDALPADAFYFTGGIDAVRARAAQP